MYAKANEIVLQFVNIMAVSSKKNEAKENTSLLKVALISHQSV